VKENMGKIILISALGKNNEIRKENKLLWHIKTDLKFFKEKTNGHPIFMGEKTFFSLPGILPNRKHIILTNHFDLDLPDEVEIYYSKEKLLDDIYQSNQDHFCIGGGQIYKEFMPHAEEMFLTHIEASDRNADTYFPEINDNEWITTELSSGEEKSIQYKMLAYKRK